MKRFVRKATSEEIEGQIDETKSTDNDPELLEIYNQMWLRCQLDTLNLTPSVCRLKNGTIAVKLSKKDANAQTKLKA